MTIFGWDISHYDWERGLTPAEIRAAAGAGIAFMTHKIGEGTGYTDPRFDDFWRATRGLGGVLLGAYYVNHPGDQRVQADRFVALLDARTPGWRDGPFILQVDAERFDYMPREPNLAEIKAFVARLTARAPAHRPIVYAPKWLFGDRLRGLGSPLWASNYGSNPAQPFRTAYPGDGSARWTAYSGQKPAILQYGSKTRIGTQHTCDANAFRGTLDALRALVYPTGEDDVSKIDVIDALDDAVPWASEGVAKAAAAAGYSKKSTRALIEYLFAALVLDGPAARAELLAAIGKVDDEVVAALSRPDTSAEEIAAVLRAALGDERAAAVGLLLAELVPADHGVAS